MPLFLINKVAVKKPDGNVVADLYYQIPLLEGQRAEDVKLEDLNPNSLIPCSGPDDAHVVRWTYGGDFRIARIGGKRTIGAGEVTYLQHKGLGALLIPVAVAEGDDVDAEATRTILTQNQKLASELEAARAESLRVRTENQQVKLALESTQRRVVELDIKLKNADAKNFDTKAYDEAVADNALLNEALAEANKTVAQANAEKQAMTSQIGDLKAALKKAEAAAKKTQDTPPPASKDAPTTTVVDPPKA